MKDLVYKILLVMYAKEVPPSGAHNLNVPMTTREVDCVPKCWSIKSEPSVSQPISLTISINICTHSSCHTVFLLYYMYKDKESQRIVLRCWSCSVFMFIICMDHIICVILIRYCLLLVTFVEIFLLNLLSTFACVYWNYKYHFYYVDW